MIHKNVELRIAQFAAAADPGRSLRFARQFVLGKIKNCRTLLRRHLPEEAQAAGLAELNTLGRKAERPPTRPACWASRAWRPRSILPALPSCSRAASSSTSRAATAARRAIRSTPCCRSSMRCWPRS